MSTATDTLTIRLVHSVGGLLAEISGLPVIAGPAYLAQQRKSELAREALHAQYPDLVVRESAVEDDQVLFWCEAL